MEIDDKHRDTIITSLRYSIHNVREYHQKMAREMINRETKWDYDYEKHSIAPIQEALDAVRHTIKLKKK